MIIPALLTDKKDELRSMIDECSKFTDYVQIDIMDGEFVPSRSIDAGDLKGWGPGIRCEAHLMVTDPLAWVEPFRAFGAERIIYHFEIKKDHGEIINAIRGSGLAVGIAVNPGTSIEAFSSFLDRVDTVLFLSVNPGFYGAEFIPEVLDKIRELKKNFPKIQIGIDGGIKLNNAHLAKAAGADYICVGSAILKSKDPKQAYERFVGLTHA